MPLPLKPVEELDQATIDAADAFVAQWLAETLPSLDFRNGVLHDVVQHPHSLLEAGLQDIVARFDAARSLLAISQSPELAEDETVDAVLSNFRVTRRPGGFANGPVTILLDSLTPVTIAKGALFVSSGKTFTSDEAFTARTSAAAVLSSNDRLLSAVPDSSGRYAFTISMTAAEAGPASQLRRGASLVPETRIPRFSSAYAAADFTGGAAPDTNQDLLNRLSNGAALQAPSNRLTTAALIQMQEQFASVSAVSEIGYGDAEQLRYYSLFPVAFGGRRDVYIRSREVPKATTLTKTAAWVTNTDDGGSTWQVSFGKSDAPGFYEAILVAPAAAAATDDSYEVTGDIRGYDLTDEDWTPNIEDSLAGAYTPYQTAVVQFKVPDELGEAGKTRSVDVTVHGMIFLRELQDFLGNEQRRPGAADILVRAAVPCFVSVSFTVFKKPGQADPDLTAIRSAVAAVVNKTGFAGRLSATQLASAVYPLLLEGQTTSALEMFGRIRRPGGTNRYLRSSDTLVVPDEPKALVSRRTVIFTLDPEDVGIAITTVAA